MAPIGKRGTRRLPGLSRWCRRAAAAVLVLAGGSIAAFAPAERDLEASVAGRAIHLVTGQQVIAVPGRHLLILYKSTSIESIFVLTSECSVAYLLAALLVGAAPLMLMPQLSAWRTAFAIAAGAAVLVMVNVTRLTAIGATVSGVGRDPGLTIAHTYLGSVLTVVGTCAAGLLFAAILLGRRRRQQRTAS